MISFLKSVAYCWRDFCFYSNQISTFLCKIVNNL